MMNDSEDCSVREGSNKAFLQDIPNKSPTARDAKPPLKPAGLGGWLILPMLGLIVSLFYLPFSFWVAYADVFEYWNLLTDPTSSYFMPLFKELTYFEVMGNVILYGTLLYLCYLFFTKKKLAVKVIIFFYVFSLILIIADVILVKELLAVPVDDKDVKEIIRGAVVCAIWIPYFLTSVRVKNTFVN
ncbi:DUF2569 domain-containing protein [Providencia manganoxydans]|nr:MULTISPECIES: DUF2569 domain-containing protein [Providencia]MDX4946691.1 DUF2569 domain-containing protein [Providencia manganoxydans]